MLDSPNYGFLPFFKMLLLYFCVNECWDVSKMQLVHYNDYFNKNN